MNNKLHVTKMATKIRAIFDDVDPIRGQTYDAVLRDKFGKLIMEAGHEVMETPISVSSYFRCIKDTIRETLEDASPLVSGIIDTVLETMEAIIIVEDAHKTIDKATPWSDLPDADPVPEVRSLSLQEKAKEKTLTFSKVVSDNASNRISTPAQSRIELKVPPPTPAQYTYTKEQQKQVPVPADTVIEISQQLKVKGLFHNQLPSSFSCNKGTNCTFCYTLGEALPLTRCKKVRQHHKTHNGQIVECHESGWWPHISRSAWMQLKKIHATKSEYQYLPGKGVRPNMTDELGPIIYEVLRPTAGPGFMNLPSSTGLVTPIGRGNINNNKRKLDTEEGEGYTPKSPHFDRHNDPSYAPQDTSDEVVLMDS